MGFEYTFPGFNTAPPSALLTFTIMDVPFPVSNWYR
jgi:hypothetical protein